MTAVEPAGGNSDPVRVLIVAIGGYGLHYLRTFWDQVPPGRARLAGVVDPWARLSPIWPEVAATGVPVADTMEAFYGSGHAADLAVVASPIHAHAPQSLAALACGSHVLCDKPLCATIQDARALVEARDRTGRLMLVGYQWSFSDAIQALKRDLLAGLFGRPLRFATLCCWPRGMAYYRRNGWAGRLRDPDTQAWVLDSPANNAMAHFLHNAFFLLGPDLARSAAPVEIQAELYRAFPIENADTAACRATTDSGVDVLFLASHATERAVEPRFRLECEDATVTFGEQGRDIVALSRAGAGKRYGDPDGTPQFRKLFAAIDLAREFFEPLSRGPAGRPARVVPAVVCGPEAAMAQTLAMNGMHESVPGVATFPLAMIWHPDADRTAVTGLDEILLHCYEAGLMPGEAGHGWSRPGATVDLRDYRGFPSRSMPGDGAGGGAA